MLVAVITALSIDQMHQQMQKANLADAFEWRLDYLTHIDLKELADLRSVISKPVIFTLRRKEEGGKYTGSEEQRLQEIQRLCLLSPDFFDLEWDLPSEFIAEICQKTKVIGSYHNFIKTPDLEKIYAQMQNQHFQQIKIATFAVSTLDQISLLCFLKKNHTGVRTVFCIDQIKVSKIAGCSKVTLCNAINVLIENNFLIKRKSKKNPKNSKIGARAHKYELINV